MSGKTIGKSLNYGYAGNYARQPDMVIGSFQVADDSRPIMFGDPVYLTADGKIRAFDEDATPENFVGVASSEIKTTYDYNNMDGKYTPGQLASVMQRGAISVICKSGNPVIGGRVYARINKGENNGFETVDDTPDTIELTNCVWRTDKDTNGVAEIYIRIVNFV